MILLLLTFSLAKKTVAVNKLRKSKSEIFERKIQENTLKYCSSDSVSCVPRCNLEYFHYHPLRLLLPGTAKDVPHDPVPPLDYKVVVHTLP